MIRCFLTCSLLILLLIGIAGPPALAAEDDQEARPSTSSPLDTTYRFVLTLTEGDTTHDFSISVVSRHFTMNLGEKAISFRGRLWPAKSGRERLEYSLEHTQWLESDGKGRQRSGSTWQGSVYLEAGRPVEIISFLGGSFTVEMEPLG